MMGPRPQCYLYQATRSLALWFWRRRFLKFLPYMGVGPSWSCNPDPANKLSFPQPIKAPHEIWLRMAQRFWRRALKMVDGRTNDGAHNSLIFSITATSSNLKIFPNTFSMCTTASAFQPKAFPYECSIIVTAFQR